MRRRAALMLLCAAASLFAPVGHAESANPQNDKMRADLLKLGDNGREARKVKHFAFPNKGGRVFSRENVRKWLESNGFETAQAGTSDGIMFSHVVAVRGQRFDKATQSLDKYLSQMGWRYDGWETKVIKR